MNFNKIISSVLLSGLAFSTQAQEITDSTRIDRQVQVVKAYQPSISDAYKLSEMPVIKDSTPFNPDFKYDIVTSPVLTEREAGNIDPVKTEGAPEIKHTPGYLKAGFGNYTTPYAELFLNKTNKGNTVGIHLYHLSSDGKVELSNDEKTEAPFSNSRVKLFGTKSFKKGKLSAAISYKRDAFNYYGGPEILLEDTSYIKARNDREINEQKFQKIAFQTNYSGTYKKDLSYSIGLDYHHFNTDTDQKENLAALTGIVNKEYKKFDGKLSSRFQYYNVDNINNYYSSISEKRQNILFEVAPTAVFTNDTWKLEAGLTADILIDDDEDTKFYAYPKVNFEWKTVEGILTTFAGINGHLQQNFYSTIAYENHFVNSMHDVKNSEHQIATVLGIRGKISSQINYKVQGSFDIVKDMHFYYWSDLNPNVLPYDPNSTPSVANTENSFSVKYDDVNYMNLKAEVQYLAKDNLSFSLIGNIHEYGMDQLSEAWNKHKWDLTLSTKVNPIDRLTLYGDLYVIGERKALTQLLPPANSLALGTQHVTNLNSIVDLNIGADYELPYNLKAFAKVNNLLGQNYQKWMGYNSYGTRLMLGACWSF